MQLEFTNRCGGSERLRNLRSTNFLALVTIGKAGRLWSRIMPSDPNDEAMEAPRLRLEHDGGPPDARQTGTIMERLAIAYMGYTRLGIHQKRPAADLVITELHAGSLFVVFRDVLETTSAVITLYEHRELMGGFVTQLVDALSMMRSQAKAPLPMFRNAIEALSSPIRSRRATKLSLTVIGDNNRILVIDKAAADDIQLFLNARRRASRRRADTPKPSDDEIWMDR